MTFLRKNGEPFKNRVKGLNGKETLLMIRDCRVEKQMTYQDIAKKLDLSPEFVFNAHIQLMSKKLLAWKPEYTTKQVETVNPETKEKTTDEIQEVHAVYFIPDQPEKKARFRLSIRKKPLVAKKK